VIERDHLIVDQQLLVGDRRCGARERDGIDDGCDACLLGQPDAEDGDGIADACDPCPAIAEHAGDDDGDGVGNDCDLAPELPQSRLVFDGFNGDHLSIIWDASLTWSVGGGQLKTPSAAVLQVRDLQIAGDTHGTWSVEAGIDLPPTAKVGAEIGIALDLASAPMTCALVYDGVAWTVQLHTAQGGTGGIVKQSGRVRLRASLGRFTVTHPFVYCEVVLGDAVMLENTTAPGPFVASFYTTDVGNLNYVEILGRR